MNIWVITYEGQEENFYSRTYSCPQFALEELMRLEEEYPDRVWRLEEKDVS